MYQYDETSTEINDKRTALSFFTQIPKRLKNSSQWQKSDEYFLEKNQITAREVFCSSIQSDLSYTLRNAGYLFRISEIIS